MKVLAKTNSDLNIYPNGKSVLVEDIESIIEKSQEKPMFGDKKIFIVKSIDNATFQAQNKLLKTLEEPPKNVIFLLTATNENKILPTIISRVRKEYLQKLDKTFIEQIITSPPEIFKDVIPANRKYIPNELKQAVNSGDGYPGKTLEFLNSTTFLTMFSTAQDIATKFMLSKELSSYSEKVVKFKDEIKLFLSLLQNVFEELLKTSNNKEGYCQIILQINKSNLELDRNVNINLIIDNLLMKILEIKYYYKI